MDGQSSSKIFHAADSIPLLEDPSSRMTKEGNPFISQKGKAWRANFSKRSEWISRRSTNPIIWSHEHSSSVTPNESRTFPVVQTSMDVISKGSSGSKLPSHVDFSKDSTLASLQCAHDRIHFLMPHKIPGHQNHDTVLQWVLYTPVCPAVEARDMLTTLACTMPLGTLWSLVACTVWNYFPQIGRACRRSTAVGSLSKLHTSAGPRTCPSWMHSYLTEIYWPFLCPGRFVTTESKNFR